MKKKNMKYITSKEALENCNKLCGEKISLIWEGIYPAIFLEVGKLRKAKYYSRKEDALLDRLRGKFNICVYDNWQLLQGKKIIMNSDKEAKSNLPLLERYLKENTISKFVLKTKFIKIYFNRGICLQIPKHDCNWFFLSIGGFNKKYLSFEFDKYYFSE